MPTRTMLVVLLLCLPALGAGTAPLLVDVHARAIAPGEPLRIAVTSAVPLAKLTGRLLGQDVFFARSSPDGTLPETWSGWAMVGLDDKPGKTALEVNGTTTSGGAAGTKLTLKVAKRTFASERLTVSKEYVEPPADVAERIKRETERVRAIYAERRAVPPPEGPFVKPVPGDPSAEFGRKRFFNGQPRASHPGIDLRAATGTPVVSPGAGLVVLAGDLYFSGGTVIVDHGGGLFSVLAHLSRIDVKEGETVTRGQPLALSGATGRVTGPHLHWGTKLGDRPFDPLALLDARVWE